MKPSSQYKSLGNADWVIRCIDEDIAVQSIFLKPLMRFPSSLLPNNAGSRRGQYIVPLSFNPQRGTIDCLMLWAIQENRLNGITDSNAKELICIGEELGMNGLIEACDVWLQNQARSGKLFGKVRQLREQSERQEFTREHWDAYANAHKLKRLAACCEASLDFSPEGYKRQPSGVIRRLSDVSWTPSSGRVSIDG